MSRFYYVKYDSIAAVTQKKAKELMEQVEAFIESTITCPRSKATALTKLEECYMWIGKGVRNDQIARDHSPKVTLNSIAKSIAPISEDIRKPFAYRSTRNPEKIVYREHQFGANGAYKRAPEMDKVRQ